MNIETMRKKYKEYIVTASDIKPKPLFSLGPLSVNLAVGNPDGVSAGRIIQIVGKQSSGKSTLALEIIRQFQLNNPSESPLYIDFERSFDAKYAESCGVDLDQLMIVMPSTTEKGLEIAENGVDVYGVKLVIIDSVAAAVPQAEFNKGYEESPKMAGNAGLITRFCGRMTPKLHNNDALLIVLNQLRMNFNTLAHEKEIPFGGMALQYATSVTLHLTMIEKDSDEMTARVVVRKNKVGSPQTKADFKIVYGKGIDCNRDIVDLGVTFGCVQKSGAWYTFNGQKVQGLASASESFPIAEIRAMVIDAYRAREAELVNE